MLSMLILAFGVSIAVLGFLGGLGAFLVLGKIHVSGNNDGDEFEIPIGIKNSEPGVLELCPDDSDPTVKTLSTDELMKMVSKQNGN